MAIRNRNDCDLELGNSAEWVSDVLAIVDTIEFHTTEKRSNLDLTSVR